MRAAGLRLAVCLAAGAVGAAAQARGEPLVSLQAASITRREALVRVLEAAGEDYAIGPGFADRVALRLGRVPLSAVLRSLLREGESTWTASGVRRVARGRPPQEAVVLRVVAAPGSDPAGLALAAGAGAGVRVAVDAEAKLLVLQGTAGALADAEKLLVEFESPLPCRCERGDRDLLAALTSAAAPVAGASEPVTAHANGAAGEALLAVLEKARLGLAPAGVEGELSYRLRGVPAGAALQALAEVLGGGRVQNGVLLLASLPPEPSTRLVAVRSRPAAQVAAVLQALAWDGGPLEVSSTRDRLLLRGNPRAVDQASSVASRLDFAPRPESNPCGCRKP